MAVFSIPPPYPQFPGADGQPLENGYIYIGEPGFEARTTPKASYFDIAQTVPTGTASGSAVRTMSGFAVRNGTPAMLYVDGDFSISVLDRNGVLVYSSLNTTLAVNVGGAIGPVLAPDGNLGATGFGFVNETNTGMIRASAGTMQNVVQGVVVSQETTGGTAFLQPVSGAGFTSAVAAIAQPLDSDLTALAGLSSNGMVARTGAGTAAVRTITAGAGVTVTNGDGVAGNPTIATNFTGFSLVATQAITSDATGLVTGLGSYRDIIVSVVGATATSAGRRILRVGNSGSGILSTSIYRWAQGAAQTHLRFTDSSTQARSFTVQINGFNTTDAVKPVMGTTCSSITENPIAIESTAAFERVQVTDDFGANNIPAGTIYVWGRT